MRYFSCLEAERRRMMAVCFGWRKRVPEPRGEKKSLVRLAVIVALHRPGPAGIQHSARLGSAPALKPAEQKLLRRLAVDDNKGLSCESKLPLCVVAAVAVVVGLLQPTLNGIKTGPRTRSSNSIDELASSGASPREEQRKQIIRAKLWLVWSARSRKYESSWRTGKLVRRLIVN